MNNLKKRKMLLNKLFNEIKSRFTRLDNKLIANFNFNMLRCNLKIKPKKTSMILIKPL